MQYGFLVIKSEKNEKAKWTMKNTLILLTFFVLLFLIGCNQVSGANDIHFAEDSGTDTEPGDTDTAPDAAADAGL